MEVYYGIFLGVIYFLSFLYSNEMNSTYPFEEVFYRQALVFLVIVAIFIYSPITKFRRAGGFKSISLSQVNIEDYMKNSSLNKQQESILYNEITDAIIKLSEMVDKGILTQEEFNSKKKDLLNRL